MIDLWMPPKPAIIRPDDRKDHHLLLPASSVLIDPYRFAVPQPNLFEIITTASLTTNLKVCLDAGALASYSGSGQPWLDLSGNGFDFNRGLTSGSEASDPTFNGSAGAVTSGEYFSLDGGDWFTYDSASESWMETLHKDNAIFTIMAMIYTPTGQTGGQRLFGNAGNNIANSGITVRNNRWQVFNGGGVAHDTSLDSAANADAWNMVGWSINEAGGNVSFGYLNGSHNTVSSSNTFDAAYTSPSAAATAFTLDIGAEGNGQAPCGSGIRFGGVAIWQGSALTKANFDTIWTAWRTRYGL